MMKKLSSAQRKYLRGLAHGLKPVVQVGRQGFTESVLQTIDAALAHHELIKIRFLDFHDQKRELCREIGERLDTEQVGAIGHVAIFYRPARDADERRIELPAA